MSERGGQGRIVTDGPFAESRRRLEVISTSRWRKKPKPSPTRSKTPVSNYGCVVEVRSLLREMRRQSALLKPHCEAMKK
jgi:hypothetical protein